MPRSTPTRFAPRSWAPYALFVTFALAGCTGQLGAQDGDTTPPSGGRSGTAAGGSSGSSTGTGAKPGSSTGTGASAAGGSTGGPSGGSTGGPPVSLDCKSTTPGRSPLRRLTTYEYNNTVRDLLGDTTGPGSMFPAQTQTNGNMFGNDADFQSVQDSLPEAYEAAAEGLAARATASATALGTLHTCASNVTTANEESCARMIATSWLPKAYRRTVTSAEVDDYVALYRTTRAISPKITFASTVTAMHEGALQSPDFLYRVEFGTDAAGLKGVKRVTGREMANRLSYFFWQSMPDDKLFQAADAGSLATNDGVLTEAKRLIADTSKKSHAMVSFYFDNLLPIPDLQTLERDSTLFPTFSPSIGAAMRKEVQRVIEYEVFENTAQSAPPYATGSWPAILTAPYTFANKALADYYGASYFASGSSVSGTDLVKVNLNPTQRLGLLTLGGVMAGTATTNLTNPVLRGSFVVRKLMCRNIQLPVGLSVKAPEAYTGKTARERFGKHSADATCHACHQFMDPVGLAFENYDAVGLYRTSEKTTIDNVNYDTPIDATGSVPGIDGTATTPVDLIKLLATSDELETCFASHWMEFAYGRSLDSDVDACNQQSLGTAFKQANYNVKELLLALTQTDGFLYRSAE